MVGYARIEPETEAHRTEKALKELMAAAVLPLEKGVLRVEVSTTISHEPAAQHVVSLLINLLLRMKGLVRCVQVIGLDNVVRHPAVPLLGGTLLEALHGLAGSLNGPESIYRSILQVGADGPRPDVTVVIGDGSGDIHLGADAWRALLGSYAAESRWADVCPLGPYMAATIGAAEVFKRLLWTNLGWSEGAFLDDLAFSLMNHGVDAEAAVGPDVDTVELRGAAIAGAGAGGTAVLYTLGSFPRPTGELLLAEPGVFKPSNLNRYLLSTYGEVHAGASKLCSALGFLRRAAPDLTAYGLMREWADVPKREWPLVVCTVDTPEARWQVQRSNPHTIVEGGVMLGTLYAVLRVVPGGWCLECKHPPDADISWRKRGLMWGVSVDEVKERHRQRRPVSRAEIERLADVQGRPVSEFVELEGMPFDQVPALTECGETPLLLKVPSQAPVLPFATTAAGVAIAAEVVKEMAGLGEPLNNYFAHDLRHRPKPRMKRFRPRRPDCRSPSHGSPSHGS